MVLDSPVDIEEDDSDTDETNDPDCAHTVLGPLDGSLYATVKKSPSDSVGEGGAAGERNSGGSSGGAIAISSLHTVSMDSGISSAGNGLLNPATNTSSSTQPSPDSQIDHHRALDELLNEMLLTVENIPDLKSSYATENVSSGETPTPMQYIDEVDHQTAAPVGTVQKDIPYHARSDSQPFSYGSVPNDAMSGLSSPSLVRKASFSKSPTPSPRPNGVLVNGYSKPNSPLRTKEPPNPVRRSNSSHNVPSARSPDFHEGSVVSGHSTLSHQNHHSSTNGSGNLTWLQLQQRKLRERREVQLRNERHPHETRLLSELRSVHQHHSKILRPSPSHRTDGYTSDTTLFADDEDFTIPLHINIHSSHGHAPKLTNGTSSPSPSLPNRTSSRNKNFSAISTSSIQRTGSNSSYERDRSFCNVKRSYDNQQLTPVQQNSVRKTYSDTTNSTIDDPCPYLSHDPGHYQQDPGLLFIAESEPEPTDPGKGRGDALSCLIETLHATPPTNRHCTAPAPTAWSHVSTHQTRDESYSSWRCGGPGGSSADETSPSHCGTRPNTPAFPVHPRTPYNTTPSTPTPTPATAGLPPKSPSAQRKDWSPLSETLQREKENRGYESDNQHSPKSVQNGIVSGTSSPSPSLYYGTSRRSSIHSNGEPPQDVSASNLNFVKDKSKYWYKPTISREEAITMLKDRPPGTFVVRDSNSFPGAFGLALKVATPPAGAASKPATDPSSELVRHFLIEPTSRGVRLKGCSNEPVFSSLSALVYQHSVLPLALPCRLSLPDGETSLPSLSSSPSITSTQLLLAQGAACNVLYLVSVDTESLTGPQAVTRAITELFNTKPLPHAAVVHFKVSSQGITLTDNKRQLFFRRHYPVASISYAGLDPEDHRWSHRNEVTGMPLSSNRCFGFVARKTSSKPDNQCHIFAEYEPEQPATAIVNFVTKVMLNNNNNQKPANI
uniref:Tensin n=1 Tax=Cacopsylla melanoneura TaxID=428564 RepID=A0A8D8PVV8_9HEMI